MAQASFTEPMVQQILSAELSGTRFERLCIDLFRDVDGVEYVPTSVSWDLGRDGRDTGLRGHQSPIICCSLRDDVSEKAQEDILRTLENVPAEGVRFCSTQNLSEHAIERIRLKLRNLSPKLELVAVDGLRQLSCLLVRFPRAFEKLYAGELENLRAALATPTGQDEKIQVTGMRIALTTQLTGDAQSLRDDIAKNLGRVDVFIGS